jgi:hypothetical protein
MANTSRARFTAHFTDAQKEAILRSVLVDGRTVADTIRAAKAGELGMPAFDIGRYAYQLVRLGRDTFEAANDEALANAVEAELKALEIAAVNHSRATRRRLKLDGTDNPAQISEAAKALSAAKRARREATPALKAKAKPAAGSSQAPDQANTPKRDDPLSSLLNLASTAPKSGSLARASKRAASRSPASAG